MGGVHRPTHELVLLAVAALTLLAGGAAAPNATSVLDQRRIRYHQQRQQQQHHQHQHQQRRHLLGVRAEGGLDTGAALRAGENIDGAPPEELAARIQALLKQNALLSAADASSRTALHNPQLASAPPLHSSGAVSAMRALVKELVATNTLLQTSETASTAALHRQSSSSSSSSSSSTTTTTTTSTSTSALIDGGFIAPPSTNCVRLRGSDMAESFDKTRFDGAEQPGSIAEKWAVWHCADDDGGPGSGQGSSGLQGQSQLHRGSIWASKASKYCEASSAAKGEVIPGDGRLDEEARARGPDELLGTLHGPEAVTLAWEHQGDCAYRGTYALGVVGKYHLALLHVRENFWGLRENQPNWPPAHYDWPLGRRGVFLESIGGRNTTDQELAQARAAYESLEPCVDAASTLDGALAFVASSRAQDIFAGPDLPIEVERKEDKHRWWLYVRPESYEWRPRSCRLRTFQPADMSKCLESRRLVFSGDSNMGALMQITEGSVCREEERKTTKFKLLLHLFGGECPPNDRISNTRHIQTKGEKFPTAQDIGPKSTVVVANFGQHPASTHHTTQKKYRADIDAWYLKAHKEKRSYHQAGEGSKGKAGKKEEAVAEAMVAMGAQEGLNVWTSTLPLLRTDPWIRSFKDWRTLSRIQLYNEYANAAAARHGWAVLDEFALTMPFLLSPHHDIAHSIENQKAHHVNVLMNLVCGAK